MHFKRKRPKSSRAGCLLCKPHKRQGSKRSERCKHNSRRKDVDAKQQLREAGH